MLIAEGLLALKIAHEATSPEQLQEILMKRLGQIAVTKRLDAWHTECRKDLANAPEFYPASDNHRWHGDDAVPQPT